ncbi:MAG TPA: hypothetical protein VKV80_05185 [Streptosporangiaceae bacterium]|nr:hypothetical protein [Streptosporangiaceae bacterium]
MTATDDGRFRETARRIEEEQPRWMVVFGVYTRQYVAFPLFHAPPGTILADTDPETLTRRMRAAERTSRRPPQEEAPARLTAPARPGDGPPASGSQRPQAL